MPEQDILSTLESNPKFQQLSEEAKGLVRQKMQTKFAGLSDQAKQIVYQKIGATSSNTGNPGNEIKSPGIPGKLWNALQVPSQKSKEGLDMIANAIPEALPLPAISTGNPLVDGAKALVPDLVKPGFTGNLPADLIKGAPKIAAETLAETAPQFIDRNAIVTAGAMGALKAGGMVAGKLGPKIARPLEDLAGLKKGTYTQAFKEPGMIVDFKAAQQAKKLYEGAKEGLKYSGPTPPTHVRVVTNATKKLALNQLTPAEAFEARKSIRALKKSKQYSMDYLEKQEKLFDDVVDNGVTQADKLYRRAMTGEKLRSPVPLNQGSERSSRFGTMMMGLSPWWVKPLFSPLAVGGSASAAGAAAKIGAQSALKVSQASNLTSQVMDKVISRKKQKKAR